MAEPDCLTASDYVHDRVIIHVDIDYFYAQVEMLKNPNLMNKPVGVRQRHMVVTSNLIAREFGVKKCMFTTEALKLCPNLVVVPGEDLSDYREYSKRVFSIMKEFSDDVEKLGLDENYVDVTHIVDSMDPKEARIEGHVYNSKADKCPCGCYERLCLGSVVAKQIRDKIRLTTGLQTCGGIAHNKFLAKLIGKTHKPNAQTVLFPCSVMDLMSSLKDVKLLTGIGPQTTKVLNEMGIYSVEDLQNAEIDFLHKNLSGRTVDWLKSVCFGIDNSEVKTTGKPKNISAEEANPVDSLPDLKKKCLALLERLTRLMKKDGRRPSLMRVSVKIFDSRRHFYTRVSKQCPISPNLFPKEEPPGNDSQVMAKVLRLLSKLINLKQFHIRLISIGFGNFIDQEGGSARSLLAFCRSDVNPEQPTTTPDGVVPETTPPLDSPPQAQGCHTEPSGVVQETQDVTDQELECPKGVDEKTFRELPILIQKEIIEQYRTPMPPLKKPHSKPAPQRNILSYFSKK